MEIELIFFYFYFINTFFKYYNTALFFVILFFGSISNITSYVNIHYTSYDLINMVIIKTLFIIYSINFWQHIFKIFI